VTPYELRKSSLHQNPRRWLVTGGAGFIGSHIVEELLRLGQHVLVLDNFSTGFRSNLDAALASASRDECDRLSVIEGDIRDSATCARACASANYVLHQAALGSVPRSVKDPATTHAVNVTGFLNVLVAASETAVERVVYASSSSVYGDHPGLPKVEAMVGRPLSPYAASKACNELYASGIANAYGLQTIGLRYFNVFGPRQSPVGPYAAVIPQWFKAATTGKAPVIFGDGETSRDFTYIANVVQANIIAATTDNPAAVGEIFNVACGRRTTLVQLYDLIRSEVTTARPKAGRLPDPTFADFRAGDVRHSLADIQKAVRLLAYAPTHQVAEGMAAAASWYLTHLA
jgi:UDP-N-acetylglucosamine/UDP-N-acetylgalactosamine 4-epimerase